MTVVAAFVAFFAFSPLAAFAVTAGAKTVDPNAVDYLLLLAAELLLKLGSLVTSVMIALLDVAIKIMSYNGFVDSPVVSAGWSIVRDTVNMFFVVVLIVIALGTIFGYHKFEWQKQVPKLMFFAIVINFSKTLCGIMIDVGQVIMLTFANALQAVAAGNFIQMFALNQQTFTKCADPTGTACTIGSFELFAGSAAALLASLWVLVTVLILVAILAWRIVMLWVLITIAPLTWFIGGTGQLTSSGAYADWWKKFNCAVAVGPILTFFLWLTLAVAGAGNLAASKGLESFSQSSKVATSIPITLFEPVHLMTFIIAMAMMYAGFQAASEFCGGASGFVSNIMSKGQGAGKALAIGGAGLGAAVAARGGRFGLKLGGKAGRAVGSELAPRLAKTPLGFMTKEGRKDIYRKIEKGAGTGIAGRAIGRLAGGAASELEIEQRDKAKELLKGMEGMSDDSMVASTKKLAAMKGKPLTAQGEKEAAAQWAAAKGNKDVMKQFTEDEMKTMQERYGKKSSELVKGNKEFQKTQEDWDIANLDMAGDLSTGDGKDALKKLTGENAGKLSDRAIAKLGNNEDFKKHIGKELSGKFDKDTGEQLTIKEAMAKGMYGKGKQALFEENGNVKADAVTKYYAGLDKAGLEKAATVDLAANLTPAMLATDPTIPQRMFRDASAAAAMSPAARTAAVEKFTSDPSAMRDLVKADPLALGNFKENELSGAAGVAAGQALDTVRLNEMLTRYKKASEAERAAMKQAMDNAEIALDAAASAGGGNAQLRAIADKFGGARVAFEERMADKSSRIAAGAAAGASAGREAQLGGLTSAYDRMAADVQKMIKETDEIEAKISSGAAGSGVTGMVERQERLQVRRRETEQRMGALDQQIGQLRTAVREEQEAREVQEAEAAGRPLGKWEI